MDERDKIRAAMARLGDVLTGIARTADAKNAKRCPYKAIDLRCTYGGGCQNQRRQSESMHCSGDQLLKFAPPASDVRSEASDQ